MRWARWLIYATGVMALVPINATAADTPPLVATPPIAAVEPPGANFPQGYLSLHGGVLWLSDVLSQIPTDNDNSVSEYGLGFRFGGAIGLQLSNWIGLEGEVSYGRAPLDWVTLYDNTENPDVPIWSNPGSGSGAALSLMANAIVGPQIGGIRPYIGVGAGMALVFSDTTSTNQDGAIVGPFTDTDWAFAAQAMAGAELALSDKVSLGARYRIQWIGPFNLYEELLPPNGFIQIGSSLWQSVEVTVKYAFGGR